MYAIRIRTDILGDSNNHLTLFALLSWLSLSVSIHVLSVIRALLMLPASLNLSPALFVLDVLSEPARSTSESWETVALDLSCRG